MRTGRGITFAPASCDVSLSFISHLHGSLSLSTQSHAPVCFRFRAVLYGPSGFRSPAPRERPRNANSAFTGMKPPQRRRAAPVRYLGEVTGTTVWGAREKRQLLRLLQMRRGQPEPDAAELARDLPGRSESEVRVSREGSEAGGGPEMCPGWVPRVGLLAWRGQDEREAGGGANLAGRAEAKFRGGANSHKDLSGTPTGLSGWLVLRSRRE